MLTAIPIWQGRISPVLDVAQRFLLVEFNDEMETAPSAIHLEAGSPITRVQQFVDLGVKKIVCGALSKNMQLQFSSKGIAVTAGICGDVDAVLDAIRSGTLDSPELAMPGGCCRGLESRGGAGLCGQHRRRTRGKRNP